MLYLAVAVVIIIVVGVVGDLVVVVDVNVVVVVVVVNSFGSDCKDQEGQCYKVCHHPHHHTKLPTPILIYEVGNVSLKFSLNGRKLCDYYNS